MDILVSAICAVLGGANSWLAVERFGRAHQSWLRTFLELPEGIPSHDTYRRVFLILDPEQLNGRFATRMSDISRGIQLGQAAFDGKTMCGSGGGRTGLKASHSAHAFATDRGIRPGRRAVDAKSNEVAAVPELLNVLELKGALVGIDAVGRREEIAAAMVGKKADYSSAVKGDQERSRQGVGRSLTPIITDPGRTASGTTARTEERSRVRRGRRARHVGADLSEIRCRKSWEGSRAIGVVTGERGWDGGRGVGTRYVIPSRVLWANALSRGVRNHRGVEDGLDRVLDVVFGEDARQSRVGNGARNFTTLREQA